MLALCERKTAVIHFSTKFYCQGAYPPCDPHVGGVIISPSNATCNLGVMMDSAGTMENVGGMMDSAGIMENVGGMMDSAGTMENVCRMMDSTWTMVNVGGMMDSAGNMENVCRMMDSAGTMVNVWGMMDSAGTMENVWGMMDSTGTMVNVWGMMDSAGNMVSHVSRLCKSASFELWKLSMIRNFLDQSTTIKLIHGFVTSRMDYSNSLLFGLPSREIRNIQITNNSAAHLVTKTRKYDDITPIMQRLH